MKKNYSKTVLLVFSIAIVFFLNYCQHEASVQPDSPCIDNQPVEDTTRVYLWPISRDTLRIYPSMIFVRFYPWVQDTTKIMELAKMHNLSLKVLPYSEKGQLIAWLCITDKRRAEYHFTPYGRDGFCNFGTDSLVEYAFGIFNDGSMTPSGHIVFIFDEDVPQARIDSLFDANGLRFLFTRPNIPTGKMYWTLVTSRSKMNVLDLTYKLRSIPFAQFVDFGFFTGGSVRCD